MNGKNINPKKAMMGPKTSLTTSKQINKPQNPKTPKPQNPGAYQQSDV